MRSGGESTVLLFGDGFSGGTISEESEVSLPPHLRISISCIPKGVWLGRRAGGDGRKDERLWGLRRSRERKWCRHVDSMKDSEEEEVPLECLRERAIRGEQKMRKGKGDSRTRREGSDQRTEKVQSPIRSKCTNRDRSCQISGIMQPSSSFIRR